MPLEGVGEDLGCGILFIDGPSNALITSLFTVGFDDDFCGLGGPMVVGGVGKVAVALNCGVLVDKLASSWGSTLVGVATVLVSAVGVTILVEVVALTGAAIVDELTLLLRIASSTLLFAMKG